MSNKPQYLNKYMYLGSFLQLQLIDEANHTKVYSLYYIIHYIATSFGNTCKLEKYMYMSI